MPKEYGVKLGTKISVQNNERIGNNIDPRKSKKFRITTFLCLPLKKKKKKNLFYATINRWQWWKKKSCKYI